MGTSTSTGTLTAGQSRTFNLAPASAVTLTLLPNARVTITESPATVTATGLGGNATRVHEPRLPGSFTYGPYPMGGAVVVENESNSGSTVTWVETSATYTKDSSGNVTGLAGPGGTLYRSMGRGAGYDPLGVAITPDICEISAQSTPSAYTTELVQTADGPGMRVVGTVVDKYVTVSIELPVPMPIRQLMVLCQVNSETHTPLSVWAGTDNVYAGTTSISKGITLRLGSPVGSNTAQSNGLLMPYAIGGASNGWTNAGALDLNNTLFTHLRVRVTPYTGNYADFTLVKFFANPARKGRIAIVADDGTKSWFQLGLPQLQARGLVCSMALISRYIDTVDSLYMTPADVYQAMANGHEVITHGPGNDAGNLIDNFSTTAERIADMVSSRQNFINRGFLPTEQQRRCYVWPQGKFQTATGDVELLDAALAEGFTNCRAATRFVPYSHAVANATRYGKMVTPIIGHQRSTSTSGAEDTENASIIDAINYCANNGMDGVLMYHKVIPTQAVFAATGATDIEVSRLASHLDLIQTHIGAGKLENVYFSDFAL